MEGDCCDFQARFGCNFDLVVGWWEAANYCHLNYHLEGVSDGAVLLLEQYQIQIVLKLSIVVF